METVPTQNIRHDLDPQLVQASVEKQIARYERLRDDLKQWNRDNKEGIAWIDPMIDSWNDRERNHYALVRVIELPQPGKRFILVYGDADDATVTTGTGPSESLERSANWFYRQGR